MLETELAEHIVQVQCSIDSIENLLFELPLNSSITFPPMEEFFTDEQLNASALSNFATSIFSEIEEIEKSESTNSKTLCCKRSCFLNSLKAKSISRREQYCADYWKLKTKHYTNNYQELMF